MQLQALFSRNRTFVAAAAVFMLAALPFLGTLKAGYTNWDDPGYTYLSPLSKKFTVPAAAAAFTRRLMDNYHPLTEIALGAEAALFGEKPATRHAVNLLLHSANAVLLLMFLLRLGAGPLPALAAAALWAVHPAQAESVAWIAERKNLLYSFFYFSGLIFYLRGQEDGRRRNFVLALAFSALSLLSKAAAVTFPLAALVLEYRGGVADRKAAALRLAPFFALAAAAALASAAAQGAGGRIIPGNPLYLLTFYLHNALLPFNLSSVYPYVETLRTFSADPPAWALPSAVFTAAMVWLLGVGRVYAIGLLFFTAHVLPHILLVPAGAIMAADRYLYMPLAGLAAALALWLTAAGGRRRQACLALSFAAVLPLSLITVRRAHNWDSSLSLWTAVISRYPEDEAANINMGAALEEAGRPQEAAGCYAKAIGRNPRNAKALANLGTLLAKSGRLDEAERLLSVSAGIEPKADTLNNLGVINIHRGRAEKARELFKLAITADPSGPDAYSNLARAEKIIAARKKQAAPAAGRI